MLWRTIPLLSWFLTKWRRSLRLRHTLVLSGMILLIMGLIFTDPDSDRVRVGGMPVPDIGPLLVTVPAPPTNLNYQAKVELGKPLVSDGRLSKNNQTSWAFCHLTRTGLADLRQT